MQDKSTAEPVQYALGEPAVRTGIAGFSMKATGVMAGGFLVFLLAVISGKTSFAFFVIVPLTALAVAAITVRLRGRSVAELIEMSVKARRRRHAGTDTYVSGFFSRVPYGVHRLPGLFASTELICGVDADGKDFAVIVDRGARRATVVFDCQLTGQTAMTQAERNRQTAEWSAWLAGLSLSGDVEHMAFVVGSRPGTGRLLATEVESIVSPSAPDIARKLMAEAADTITVGIPEIIAHISITVHMDRDTAGDDERIIQSLATRLPGWYTSLAWSGILATPMAQDDVVARVHGFFNPAAEADFEYAAITGQEHGLPWEQAGCQFARSETGCYAHEGCVSVSWEMLDAPRSTFQDTLLQGLVAPHSRINRKRVCLIYRPFEAGAGASKVEAEHRDAMVAASSSRKVVSARAEMRLEHTEAARRAQARGAQLGRYSLFVTATVAGEEAEQLERVETEVEHLAAGSSVRLSKMTYQHDAGFQISVGMGQVPWDHSSAASKWVG